MIALGADHGGYKIKEAVKAYLQQQGIPYKDFGTDSEESVDYAIFAARVAHSVASGECEKGVLCCGTGIGISKTDPARSESLKQSEIPGLL